LLLSARLSHGEAMLCAALIGLCAGAESDLIAFLTAKYFGLKHYGQIYGVQYAVFGLASGISPLVFAKVFDHFGNYGPILKVSAVFFVAGALLLLTLGRYPNTVKNRD
jgi:MFS transporter, OFA family, oxalate/formate antiporter